MTDTDFDKGNPEPPIDGEFTPVPKEVTVDVKVHVEDEDAERISIKQASKHCKVTSQTICDWEAKSGITPTLGLCNESPKALRVFKIEWLRSYLADKGKDVSWIDEKKYLPYKPRAKGNTWESPQGSDRGSPTSLPVAITNRFNQLESALEGKLDAKFDLVMSKLPKADAEGNKVDTEAIKGELQTLMSEREATIENSITKKTRRSMWWGIGVTAVATAIVGGITIFVANSNHNDTVTQLKDHNAESIKLLVEQKENADKTYKETVLQMSKDYQESMTKVMAELEQVKTEVRQSGGPIPFWWTFPFRNDKKESEEKDHKNSSTEDNSDQ